MTEEDLLIEIRPTLSGTPESGDQITLITDDGISFTAVYYPHKKFDGYKWRIVTEYAVIEAAIQKLHDSDRDKAKRRPYVAFVDTSREPIQVGAQMRIILIPDSGADHYGNGDRHFKFGAINEIKLP